MLFALQTVKIKKVNKDKSLPDFASSRKQDNHRMKKAGLLTSPVFDPLPIHDSEQWLYAIIHFFRRSGRDYSCATARDSHTIPYYLRPWPKHLLQDEATKERFCFCVDKDRRIMDTENEEKWFQINGSRSKCSKLLLNLIDYREPYIIN